MSDTSHMHRFSPSYWTYVAAVTSEHLHHVIERKRTDPANLLAGVHRECKRLFALVKGGPSHDHLEHLNAYCAMIDLLKECGIAMPHTFEEVDRLFASYAEFADGLEHEKNLTDVELMLAGDLQKILDQLHHNGEDQAYLDVVRDDF